jgi:hypothetical protein
MFLTTQLGAIGLALLVHYSSQRLRNWQDGRLAQQAILASRRSA